MRDLEGRTAFITGGAETFLAPLISLADPVNDTSGNFTIKNGGTLVLDVNAIDNTQTIAFGDATGVLEIGQQVTLDVTQTPRTIAASVGSDNLASGCRSPIPISAI